ncbi:MAG: single-stranded-DNA-specific exonuclease RecJ [Bacteroidetes bacterium 4572_112]|nr:MAG: single-stranded-DNA-specific exonuclease RecJ [Bacteroidetes bacterium 4572_112]
MEKRWTLNEEVDSEIVDKLSKSLNINKVLAKLLVGRGIDNYEEAKKFFRPSLDSLHDPFLMLNMDKAIDRIDYAIANEQNILIYGDYDVDGTTSVALVYSYFKNYFDNNNLNSKIDFYIPDRYKEGYGISFDGIDYAENNKQSLIIALDCGIKSVDKIEYANSKNIDFIICDHHTPGDIVPDAAAVLDPKQKDCNYPYKELSGCGVGFKLLQGFNQQNNIKFATLEPYLDLVAISIAADIVKVDGENRVLAHFGLKRLNTNPRPGIEWILNYSNINRQKKTSPEGFVFDRELSISDIVFTIAPRINAAGRMDTGKRSVDLLICTRMDKAKNIAENIDKYNSKRRTLDTGTTEQALEIIANNETLKNAKSTVVYHETWHKGVLGIVASRLTETYYRPTIVLALVDGIYTGSARSVKGFDVYEAIDSCNHLLDSFGGHMYAAGLSLKEENIDEFVRLFEKYVSENISLLSLRPEITIDSYLSIDDITDKFYNVLKQFAPFGPGNMSPVFISDGLVDTGYARVVGKNHLKMQVCYPENRMTSFNGIGFGLADKYSVINTKLPFEVAYSINENVWKERVSLQFMIKDIRISEH